LVGEILHDCDGVAEIERAATTGTHRPTGANGVGSHQELRVRQGRGA